MNPPRTRRLVFALLTAALVLVAVEFGSWLLLALTSHRLVTVSDLAALRAQRMDPEPVLEIPAPTGKEWNDPRIVSLPALHPYIGYVSNATSHPEDRLPTGSDQAMEYGFPLNSEDIFRDRSDQDLVVGVFGGSFAAGFSVIKRRVLGQLDKVGRFAGKNLLVMTFAVAGHKQPQQLMALNYLLSLGARIDLVINLDGFNEIALPAATNVPFGYSAFYPRGWPLMVGNLDRDARQAIGDLTYLRRLRADRAGLFSRAPLPGATA